MKKSAVLILYYICIISSKRRLSQIFNLFAKSSTNMALHDDTSKTFKTLNFSVVGIMSLKLYMTPDITWIHTMEGLNNCSKKKVYSIALLSFFTVLALNTFILAAFGIRILIAKSFFSEWEEILKFNNNTQSVHLYLDSVSLLKII